jgi:hypothetical protein
MVALKTYLDNRPDIQDLGPDLLEAAQQLLSSDRELV